MFRVVKRTIKLENGDLDYFLRFSFRTKNIRITIKPDSSIVVSQPFLLSESRTEKFIRLQEKWIVEKIEKIKNNPPILTSGLDKLTKKDYLLEKEKVLNLVLRRLEYFNKFYNLSFSKVSIRNQKTRWGSCSVKGTLNFNFRIYHLEPALQDYIIIHELCHLKELNHSSRFWDLVALKVPNYKELRKKLKKGNY